MAIKGGGCRAGAGQRRNAAVARGGRPRQWREFDWGTLLRSPTPAASVAVFHSIVVVEHVPALYECRLPLDAWTGTRRRRVQALLLLYLFVGVELCVNGEARFAATRTARLLPDRCATPAMRVEWLSAARTARPPATFRRRIRSLRLTRRRRSGFRLLRKRALTDRGLLKLRAYPGEYPYGGAAYESRGTHKGCPAVTMLRHRVDEPHVEGVNAAAQRSQTDTLASSYPAIHSFGRPR